MLEGVFTSISIVMHGYASGVSPSTSHLDSSISRLVAYPRMHASQSRMWHAVVMEPNLFTPSPSNDNNRSSCSYMCGALRAQNIECDPETLS